MPVNELKIISVKSFQSALILPGTSGGERFGERVRPCTSTVWYVFVMRYRGNVDLSRIDDIPAW